MLEVRPPVPAQEAPGIPGVVRRVVEDVARDMSGRPEDEVLAALTQRLAHALPGITIDQPSLEEHARAIHAMKPPSMPVSRREPPLD